jgi:hypothetical protein
MIWRRAAPVTVAPCRAGVGSRYDGRAMRVDRIFEGGTLLTDAGVPDRMGLG